jgi:hypothetical protein
MAKGLVTARSSFNLETLTAPARCRGCRRPYKAGASVYVQHWVNLGHPARTVLCNLESCWEEFDEEVYGAANPCYDDFPTYASD